MTSLEGVTKDFKSVTGIKTVKMALRQVIAMDRKDFKSVTVKKCK